MAELADARDLKSLGREAIRVRAPSPAPRRSKLCIACSDFFQKSERAHAAAPPFRKRSRSRRLFACKRAHDGFGSLPTFFGRIAPRGMLFVSKHCRLLRRQFAGSDFFIKKSLLTHSVAAPFRIEPASLGFDSVFFLKPKMSIILLRLFFKSQSALTPLLLLSEKGHARAACSLASALTTALARYQPFSGKSRRGGCFSVSTQRRAPRRQSAGSAKAAERMMRSAACFLDFRRRAHPMVTATFITPSRRPSNRA